MAKKRTIVARFPDGREVKRVTDRIYTHVVGSSWVGRPDLVEARKTQQGNYYGRTYTSADVAEVVKDPWNFVNPNLEQGAAK